MKQNPLHERLQKLDDWQLIAFTALLCERMYPNYVFFCQQTEFADPKKYRAILNTVWEKLNLKNAKINFDTQLEKLEKLIPETENYVIYAVYPANDACEALSNALHSFLSDDATEYAILTSQLSIRTIIELEEHLSELDLANESRLKENQAIQQEIDLQWDIYRLLKSTDKEDAAQFLDELKKEIRDIGISNIGISVL